MQPWLLGPSSQNDFLQRLPATRRGPWESPSMRVQRRLGRYGDESVVSYGESMVNDGEPMIIANEVMLISRLVMLIDDY